jgi:hypothetical protein
VLEPTIDPKKHLANLRDAAAEEARKKVEEVTKPAAVPEIPDAAWIWMMARAKEPITWVGIIGYLLGAVHLNTNDETITMVANVVAFISSTLLIILRQRIKG